MGGDSSESGWETENDYDMGGGFDESGHQAVWAGDAVAMETPGRVAQQSATYNATHTATHNATHTATHTAMHTATHIVTHTA